MPPDIAALRAEFESALASASTVAHVRAIHDRFLSRKNGAVTAILKSLGSVSPEERRVIGAAANELRQTIEVTLDERERMLAATAPPADALDVTLAGRVPPIGRRHPLTQIRERIESIFSSMG